jgi:hypothetical protein
LEKIMTIANGSRHSMAYTLESVYGTTPTSPVFKMIRHNGTTLALSKSIYTSAELRSDRQITDMRHGTKKIGGNITSEFSGEAFDDLIQAAMGGTWTTGVLKAGTTRRSFTIERDFADIGQYLRYTGVELDGFDIDVKAEGIVPIVFNVVGMDQSSGTAILSGATYTPAPTNSPYDGFSGTIKEGGSVIAVLTEVKCTLANNLAAIYVVGSAETLEPSIGKSTVTGTVTAYFQDTTMLNKFVNETESSIEFTLTDGTNSYDILLPRVKYTGAPPNVSSDKPITLAMPFSALLDSVTGTNIEITRTPA